MARANNETIAEAVLAGSVVRVNKELVRSEDETVVGTALASDDEGATSGAARSSRRPPVDAEPVGVRVGHYILDEFLAVGGFGVVYRAHEEATGRAAAIKILHAELASSPDLILRFEREVLAIKRVKHPNVIEVYACGRLADGRPYFAMEMLRGLSLEEYLRTRGRLPAGEVLSILEPLCEALCAAHEQSIVHRDIKASNIFLAKTEKAGERRVVLLDFGVAKLLDESGPAITKSRHVVGTLACMSPEQLLGQPVDARTDIYALGALTFFLVTGEHPFANSPFSVLHQMHLHARPPKPSTIARVSALFDEPVLRAMSKDKSARFENVGAFLDAIREAMRRSRVAVTISDPGDESETPDLAPRERRAIGVYFEVLVDSSALEAGDEHILSDMESILPQCYSELSRMGFAVAVETGTSMLLVLERPTSNDVDDALRRDIIVAVQQLDQKLSEREGRNEAVRVLISVDLGGLFVSEEGTLIGGGLLELSSWVPEALNAGVFISPAIRANVNIASD